jgi:hypothetical protein
VKGRSEGHDWVNELHREQQAQVLADKPSALREVSASPSSGPVGCHHLNKTTTNAQPLTPVNLNPSARDRVEVDLEPQSR